MKRLLVLALVVGLAATACGSNKKSSSKSGGSTSVTISNEQGTTWTCGFNPFNASVSFLSFGTEYEELTYVDGLKSGATTPWLAKSYAWSNGNKTLTFTIRDGVKWSDGKPFSAADVVYTFQLLKKNPALDLNANWSVLKSVTQNGNKVVFKFKTPAVPYFYYIADQTPIVAKHIWTTIKNPTTYKDEHPVGTGPFTMSSCSPQVIKYKKNPSYWQAGKPVDRHRLLPGVHVERPGEPAAGERQGAVGQPVHPEHQRVLRVEERRTTTTGSRRSSTSRSTSTRPTRSSTTSPCGRRWRTRSTARRSREIGEYGYEPPSNQTGIVTPTFSDWLDQGLAKKVDYDPAKAEQILQQAGYKKSGGIYQTPDGKPLSFTMINIGGYSDWVASAQIVAGAAEGGRDQGHAAEPLEPDLRQRRLQRPLPARLRREPDRRARRRTTSCGRSSTRRARRRSARRPDPTGSGTRIPRRTS